MKYLSTILFTCVILVQSAFGQDPFNSRLQQIRTELDSYSDSTIPGLQESVNFDISNAPIQEFLGLIAETHKLNITIAPDINVMVTNKFTDAQVKDVLYFLCSTYQLDVRFINNIVSVVKYVPPKPEVRPYTEKTLDIQYNPSTKQLTLSLERDSLKLFTKQFTQKTGINVSHTATIENVRVSGFLQNVDTEAALERLTYANKLRLEKVEDNFFVIDELGSSSTAGQSSRSRTGSSASRTTQGSGELIIERFDAGVDTYLTIDAVDVPIIDMINEASILLDKDFFIFSKPEGTISLKTKQITFNEFLDYILNATDHTYKIQEGKYIIGRRDLEGLRKTELVKLKFRAVDEIDTYIPAELKQGVELSIFKELNAVILSGSSPMIREIKEFIKEIDEPVPNIMIEVIVIDDREGYSLQTGIQAFLTDSANAPNTTGSVFPGVDVTLGTDAINNVLDKVNVLNLGKVTPRFYATLKALEDNNNIDIRSTPKLATLNGHEATLTIGQSVYFVQQTQNINPGVNPITTISQQFRQVEANLSLLINPVVSGNEHITLNINAEFSNFIPPEFENAPPGNATRRFTSQIRVQNGEMIVLGGLEELTTSETSSGVPLLSRIPIIKWLFSSRSKEKSKDRLLVFIKPTVVF